MAAQADRITAGDLTDRVTPHHHGSEVGRLGAALNGTLMRQASMQAYNDAWLLLLVCFICVAPAVFLLRKPAARNT